MRPLLPGKAHFYVYVFALVLLVIGLPLSKFLMSLSQIILFVNWVLEGNLLNKLRTFASNKPAVVFSSVILLHLLGLAYTSDFDYAFRDIRIKAPLLVLPLVLSSSTPLSQKQFDIL